MADGLYQELQTSDLDLTKMLESSEKQSAASDADAGNKNECHLYLEVPLVSPLKDSTLSISSSSSTDGNGKCSSRAGPQPAQVAEMRSFGTVSRNVYFSYIAAGGSAFKISVLVFVCLYTQVLCTGGAYWISHWYAERRNCVRHLYSEKLSFSGCTWKITFSATRPCPR